MGGRVKNVIEVQVRREGNAVASVARPMKGGHVCVGGAWREVQRDGETPFVEIGPLPTPGPRLPLNRGGNAVACALLAMAAVVSVGRR